MNRVSRVVQNVCVFLHGCYEYVSVIFYIDGNIHDVMPTEFMAASTMNNFPYEYRNKIWRNYNISSLLAPSVPGKLTYWTLIAPSN